MNEHQFMNLFPKRKDFTRWDSICKTRIDRVYVNNNFEVKHYTTKLLVDSDHLTVICGVSFKGEDVNYWKLNTDPEMFYYDIRIKRRNKQN